MFLRKTSRKLRSVWSNMAARALLLVWRRPGLFPVGEALLYLDPRDGLSGALRRIGAWEPLVQKWICQQAGRYTCIWELGSCMGFFSYLLAQNNPESQLYGFEPFPKYFALLSRSFEANQERFPRVEFIQAAVAPESGVLEFRDDVSPYSAVEQINNACYGHLANARQSVTRGDVAVEHPVKVPVINLEQAAERTQSVPELVFMDIEGGEQGILRSLEKLGWHPDVLMEVHPEFYRDCPLEESLASCERVGYRVKWVDGYHVFLTMKR